MTLTPLQVEQALSPAGTLARVRQAGALNRVAIPYDFRGHVAFNNVPNQIMAIAPQVYAGPNPALQFPVDPGVLYGFRFFVVYDVDAPTTGVRATINGLNSGGGADDPLLLAYRSEYGLTATSRTYNESLSGYQQPAASNASSPSATGNIAIVEGVVQPSDGGIIRGEFAVEIANYNPLFRYGSFVDWWRIV